MIEQIIQQVIHEHCGYICNNVKARWNSQAVPGKAEISTGLPLIVGNLVTGTVNAMGAKAWELELGTGSSMDKTSPYLQAYISSPEFNKWRLHNLAMPIMGRSKGEYRDLDGNTHVSTGRMAGLDLERDGKNPWQPLRAQHIIKETVLAELPSLILHIQRAVKDYAIQQLTMSVEIYV